MKAILKLMDVPGNKVSALYALLEAKIFSLEIQRSAGNDLYIDKIRWARILRTLSKDDGTNNLVEIELVLIHQVCRPVIGGKTLTGEHQIFAPSEIKDAIFKALGIYFSDKTDVTETRSGKIVARLEGW